MKNLLFTTLLLFSFAALGAYGPQGRSANKAYDGSVMTGTDEDHFVNVLNKSGGQLLIGNVAVADPDDLDASSVGFSTLVAGSKPVCVLTASCAAGALCKRCQTWGYHSQILFDANSGATASRQIYISLYATGSVGAKTPAAGDIPVGVFKESTSSGTGGYVKGLIQISK